MLKSYFSTDPMAKGPRAKWPEEFRVEKELIKQSKATRRMKRLAYRMARSLERIQNAQKRRKSRAQNLEIRRQVRTLKAEKRRVHQRVRNTYDSAAVYLPRDTYFAGSLKLGPQRAYMRGTDKSIVDFVPTARLNPPRNPVEIKSVRFTSLSASIFAEAKPINQWARRPKGHWAAAAIGYAYPISSKMTSSLGWSDTHAEAALQKAVARVNEAQNLDANEYIVEFRQVLNLLKDPVRTLLRLHKTLEKWTRRDAWIYIPDRTFRRCNGGTLVSKPPLGAKLMSMRTRRVISASEVSSSALHEAANRWLQYRYGIAPLAKDITKVMSLWAGEPGYSEPLKSKTARHFVSRAKLATTTANVESPFTVTYRHEWVKGEHYTAKQWYRLKHDIPDLAKWNLHPEQWLRVFWNALPFSFVADWVVNIDQWLLATMDPPWIQLTANVITQKKFEKTRTTGVSALYGSYPAVITGFPFASKSYEGMQRVIDYPLAPGPVLSDAWQTVKNAGTALALILTSIKRR